MESKNYDFPASEGSDEIYSTSNIAIRWLGNRLINAIMSLLLKTDA